MLIQIRDLYGLKYNPFSPDVPQEALLETPAIADFLWKIEHGLCAEGGFGMITGAPGVGKSVTARITAKRIEGMRDALCVPLQHPQSNVADFYRELAECLMHRLRAAGNTALMTQGLIHTLCEHALGNPRVLLNTAGELLHAGAQRGAAQLDEKLYLEVHGQATDAAAPKRAAGGRRR